MTSIQSLLSQAGANGFGIHEGISIPGRDKVIYPTRKTGIYFRQITETKYSSLITLFNLPTMPESVTREVVRVNIPNALGLYLISEAVASMANRFPLLDPYDFSLQGDHRDDSDLIIALRNSGRLELDMDAMQNHTITYEPQWLPDVRKPKAVHSIRTRLSDTAQITTIEAVNSGNLGELRVFPGGSELPLLVVPCTRDEIVFENCGIISKFPTLEDLLLHIVTTPRLIGAYDNMPENILTGRILHLLGEVTEWAEMRKEVISDGIIESAITRICKKTTVVETTFM